MSSSQSCPSAHAESSTDVPLWDDESHSQVHSQSPTWAMSDIASGRHLTHLRREEPQLTHYSIKSELTKSPDSRILRRSPELPPQQSSTSTSTQPAISASYNTRIINSSSYDVPPIVNSSAYLSSPVTRTDAFSHYLGPSVSSSPATPLNNVLTHRRQRPRTSNQVFTAPHGKITPHGIPQSLPPAPSTAPRRIQPPEPLLPDFTALLKNYQNMLAQNPTDNTMEANTATTFVSTQNPDLGLQDMERLLNVISDTFTVIAADNDERFPDLSSASSSSSMPPPLTPQTPDLSSPAWSDNDFFSPDSDFLNTPLFADNNDDMLTGMFNDGDFGVGALFPSMDHEDSYEKLAHPALPTLPDNLITMTPESPSLHDFNTTVDPSSLYPSPRVAADLPSFPSSSPAGPIQDSTVPVVPVAPAVAQDTRRKSNATGTRKGVTPEALVPVDAPTQPRKYVLPSATSRKELPSVFARKRSRSTAFGEEDDEFNEAPPGPDATEREQIEYKRRQNTVAARRSRKRKLEYQRNLEANLEHLTRERDVWKTRTMILQELLQAHGVPFPHFSDVITED
ncbi:hypothetical protein H2248_007080 [Termitomyces sp. 'cryptogamus']|nr:hypothetical protein H2248_007080 [Termitomyces sp. 'cryptogamus']